MLNENAQKWVDALRSGKYKQARLQLAREGGFCCLGVACEVAKKEGVIDTYIPSMGALPEKVRAWLGLTDREGYFNQNGYSTSLVSLNDEDRASFTEIADTIERQPGGLFR